MCGRLSQWPQEADVAGHPLSWEPWGTEQGSRCPWTAWSTSARFPSCWGCGRRPGGGEATPEAFPAPPTREATSVRTMCFLDSTLSFQQNSPKVICRRDSPSALPTGRPASPTGRANDLGPSQETQTDKEERPRGSRRSSERVRSAVTAAIKAQSPACPRRSPHSSSGSLRLCGQGTACGLSPRCTPEGPGAADGCPPPPAPGSPDRGHGRRSPELPKRLHLHPTRHVRRLPAS